MSIESGMEITIGKSLAHKNRYLDIVGLRGKVIECVNESHNGHRLYKIHVHGRRLYREWYIYEEDCIPLEYKNNKEAVRLLKKEL